MIFFFSNNSQRHFAYPCSDLRGESQPLVRRKQDAEAA
jgi:hypothetical protein